MKLSTKINLCLSVIFFLFIAVVAIINHQYKVIRENKKIENKAKEYIRSSESQIYEILSNLLLHQEDAVQFYLQRIKEKEELVDAQVVTIKEFIEDTKSQDCDPKYIKYKACINNNNNLYTLYIGIVYGHNNYGYLKKIYYIDTHEFLTFPQLWKVVFLFIPFVIVVFITISQMLKGIIIKPLSTISNKMEPLASGNFDIVLPNQKSCELKKLVKNISSIISALKLYQNKAKKNAKLAAIGQTTSMLAHDVRKPFSLIKSVLNSLDACKKDPVLLKDAKKAIGNSINHVELMINDIMDFASNVTLQVAPTPIGDVLTFSINIIAQHFSNAQVQLNYLFMHGHQPLLNGERMSRVIINIMSNAIEAMMAVDDLGDMFMWIQTIPIEMNNKKYMQLIIGNKGSHISEDDLPQLFESFFTKGKKGGIGIGLASAQKIVNLHGGEIIARNSVNPDGVEFVITLPMSDSVDMIQQNELPHTLADALLVSDQSITDDKRSQKVDQLKQNERSYKILLLEDEILYRASVRNTIKERADLSERITLYDAHTVDEAVTLLQKEAITHAIVDIDLADDKTGFEFLSIARDQYPNVMLMVHTNRCIDADKEKAFDLGASAFVPKPLTVGDLIDFLASEVIQRQPKGLPLNAQMQGACESAPGAYTRVREDCRRSGQHSRWAFNDSPSFLLVNDENYILTVLKSVLEDYMSANGIQATYHTALNYGVVEKRPSSVFPATLAILTYSHVRSGYEFTGGLESGHF